MCCGDACKTYHTMTVYTTVLPYHYCIYNHLTISLLYIQSSYHIITAYTTVLPYHYCIYNRLTIPLLYIQPSYHAMTVYTTVFLTTNFQVRNMQETPTLNNYNINLQNVHFTGLQCTISIKLCAFVSLNCNN